MSMQRSVSVKRFFETASGLVFLCYLVLFIEMVFVLCLALFFSGCVQPPGASMAKNTANTNTVPNPPALAKQAAAVADPAAAVPSAQPQFVPRHRCTNCPPILPTTNILISWSYGGDLVSGCNVAYFGSLRRVCTNYLQVWYCPSLGAKWALWTNTLQNPVTLPCTNAMGLYGFQLAWL